MQQTVGPPAQVSGNTLEEQLASVSWYTVSQWSFGELWIDGKRELTTFDRATQQVFNMYENPRSNIFKLEVARAYKIVGGRIYRSVGIGNQPLSQSYDSVISITPTRLETLSLHDSNPAYESVRTIYIAMPKDYRLW